MHREMEPTKLELRWVNGSDGSRFGVWLSALLLAVPAGCGDLSRNQTASLGGTRAGDRGTIRVVFINNTPHRAVFTAGTYDQLDRESQPDFVQFSADGNLTLDGDATSDIGALDCGRVFAMGSPGLLVAMRENLAEGSFDDESLVDGVRFIDPATDEVELVEAGSAPAFEALIGVDFPCNALLIIYLEFDDVGPDEFRVDFELIASESDR